ncbi:hypothetical protein EVC30_058 [Rhizobium phage RHph_Y1_11]|nr:hypothetical protein EVC30_058 [Rhizobium phage RHph_Y1_11]
MSKKKVTLPALGFLKQAVEENQAKAATAIETIQAASVEQSPDLVIQTDGSVETELTSGAEDAPQLDVNEVLGDQGGDAPKEEPKADATAPVEAKEDTASLAELVKVRMIPGTIEHGTKMSNGELRWMRTPTWKGRERWFDRTKINSWGKDDKGMFAIVTRKEVVQRDMQQFIEPIATLTEVPAADAQEGGAEA